MNAHPDETRLCIVCLCATDGIGPRSIRRLLSATRTPDRTLRDILDWPREQLQTELDIERKAARAIAHIEGPLIRGRKVLDELTDAGCRAVRQGEPDFPEQLDAALGNDCPPLLFLRGDPDVLRRPMVAVVGSRNPTCSALQAARRFSADMGAAGWTVVSGGARGIDTAVHRGAMETCATAVVPPRGILRFRWRRPAREIAMSGRWCTVGQFPPRSGWKDANPLIRNRTIVALARATVAFEPRDRGGTWHSSRRSLRMRRPLFVVNGSDESSKKRGLHALKSSGATVLDSDDMPDPETFANMVEQAAPESHCRQRSMFDA